MNAKKVLFVSSAVFVAIGVAGIAILGAVAKVPSPEYWPVVLGGAVVGLFWIGLITGLHFRAEFEARHGLLDD